LIFLVEIKGKEHGKRNLVSSRLLEMVAEYSGVFWGRVKPIVSGLPFSPRKLIGLETYPSSLAARVELGGFRGR
jgi:hypothetical protein